MAEDSSSTVKRGRPALPDDLRPVPVSARLKPELHDLTCLRAIRDGDSITAVIEKALERYVRPSIAR